MKKKGRVLAEGLIFPEGPRWHADAFWFSDIYAKTVNRIDSAGRRSVVATVPGRPSGLGWLPDGGRCPGRGTALRSSDPSSI